MTITLDRNWLAQLVLDEDLYLGVDGGGTKTDVRAMNRRTGKIFTKRYVTSDFASPDALLNQIMLDLGAIPGRIVLALAGARRPNGDVQMTNQPDWPIFDLAKTAERLGTVIETVNDMVATAAGLATRNLDEQKFIKQRMVIREGTQLVVTVSTGVGDVVRDYNGNILPGEGGHMTWCPMTPLEERYLKFLRAKYGTDTITVEVAVSGKQGFQNLYEFLRSEGRRLRNLFKKQYRRNVKFMINAAVYKVLGKGIGPLITSGAIAGDPFCREAMNIFGSILGQYVHNRALTCNSTGGVFFVGSVMLAPGVADYVVVVTPFLERMAGKGAQHSDMLEDMAVLIDEDPELPVKGALALALAA